MNLAAIIALLRNEIGLDVETIGDSAVQRAAQQRMTATACRDLAEYGVRLTSVPDEMQELVEQVVVPETWFFREELAFECLRQQARLRVAGGANFQVASLPCSTGEEPYSIAMALFDLGLPAANFSVHALDVSYRALTRASQGVYGEYAFRNPDTSFRARYFEQAVSGYRLCQAVKDQVSLIQGNVLALPATFARAAYDVVFSRNLLIYLDQRARQQMVAELKRILSPSGILLVGHAEVSILMQAGFVRRTDGALQQANTEAQPVMPSPVGRSRLAPRTLRPAFDGPKKVSARYAQLNAKPPLASDRSSPVQSVLALSKPALSDEVDAIRALANAGQLDQARVRGEKQLLTGQRSADLYCVMGLVVRAQGDAQTALDHYRRAVYLDPQHQEAGLQLAMLLAQAGETGRARSLRERVSNSRQSVGGFDGR